MSIQIITFGRITEIVGKKMLDLEYVTDTDNLVHNLHEQYPAIASVNYAISVNEEMILGNTIIQEGDKVAILPPFSGG